ncbi:MAG: ribonuclease III [Oscillospiraceae bacterium]|nr:ribonuclease III [Oscillospiraceae bacterium]MBR2897177.1 ribonuclease III [Oscillospiraceae bacterium]MBR2976818.1 ribonuclease III [Oscillospiraceae bacterium]MBR3849714.1 ribonuclease III [Oscillospiraceae bacterium]
MYSKLEEKIGYTFSDRAYLELALTHSSYANERRAEGCRDNERLEFLGDSVLGFIVAKKLYSSFPDRPEGELTKLRADLVCETNLAAAAAGVGLGDYLRLGSGEDQSGGRKRSSITSDAMESVIAAAYLDGGLSAAETIIDRLILKNGFIADRRSIDYKTRFQELVQREKGKTIHYVLVEESGPDHDKQFTVKALLNGKIVGQGSGRSKKRAEQDSAKNAIEALYPNETL